MGIVVHFDGLCEPKNPGGVATFGFTVDRDGRRVHEECGLAATPYSEEATNNVAEYGGILKALEWLVGQKLQKEPVVVRGDSELVIKQVQGQWKIKSPLLAPLNAKVRALALQFPSLRFEWVPRDENRQADALTNRAYAEFQARTLKAPTTDAMTVHLVVAAPRDKVAAALRGAGFQAELEPVPGGTRVQCDLPTEPEAVRRLLELKSRLEGTTP